MPNVAMAAESAVGARYAACVAAGDIEYDHAQERVLKRLEQLERELKDYRPTDLGTRGWITWLITGGTRRAPRGLYLWGDVGRGKTMLMDLFFAALSVMKKRRAHFHEFMAEVQERIHIKRTEMKRGLLKDSDPVRFVADDLAEETSLLCFDEFHVTDIADAMILGRLFGRLFARGVVLVATSNVPPAEQYKGGLNRALLIPFIRELEARVEVLRLDARTDFRLEKFKGVAVWHMPADAKAKLSIDLAWQRLAGAEGGEAVELTFRGHAIHVPRAGSGAARFKFADLCEMPFGAADFVHIAHIFHTVIVEDIPVIAAAHRNEVKRFILLIDALYDNAVKLIASAAAEPDRLYLGSDGFEALEFRRAASRLIEMRSNAYLALPHGRRVDLNGVSETANQPPPRPQS